MDLNAGLRDFIPKSARYEGGEKDERIKLIFPYAMGLLGGGQKAVETAKCIEMIYDHKGDLFVVTKTAIFAEAELAFQKAWAEMAYEIPENVHFVDVNSEEWNRVWSARRY